jgi:ATP-dependent RNA helicase SUPV3L1/SUV3
MALMPYERPRVLAVLGPTNTGKTHFAVERMLAHRSGLIGFPLRLLAREIYDRIVVQKGAALAALITGEERIQPPTARYFVATVEAMPTDLDVSFLAVDEIQLCADPERGHIFTGRLLHARGRDETMFLGADTIRPLLKLLVPEAEVITRPRFSTLTYTAPAKVTRLPRRSAVVAFTAQDVYALAELVRRRRGGAAVVLGALSPRTRNAQVALYQAGEVDYLIATDAIGMGLNMDLGHVALASLGKFDGRERRPLHAHEVAQIAGRAGRHMQDGTFGTTHDVGGLDPKIVEAVETHSFPALRQLYWRAGELDFGSLTALLDSLDMAPSLACLLRTGDALDHVSLKVLSRRASIRDRVTAPDRVRLLWSVCQIPDFRKTLTDAHLNLLHTVFDQLAERDRLPTDWVADQIARLERTDGDIDALITRLAHIRTWTYVAYRDDWLDSSSHWQERARAVEDRLSDALHERLTQRFIDRRTQALLKSLQNDQPLAAIEQDGAILVDGHPIGRIEGLRYILEPSREGVERRALGAAARRVLGPEIGRRAKALVAAPDDAFALDAEGRIQWPQARARAPAPVGRLLAGPTPLVPRLELLLADSLSGQAREAVRRRLAQWLDGHLAAIMLPLRRLQGAELEGAGRGLSFLLVEGLGNVRTAEARALLKTMSGADRTRLGRLGVRFGVRQVYLPAMLKPRAIELRARLWATHRRAPGLAAPPAGVVAFAFDDRQPKAFAQAIGFEVLGSACLRIDIVERLGARLRALAREGPFALEPELMALTGLGPEQLGEVVEALGYDKDGDRYLRRRVRARPGVPAPRRKPESGASPFAVLRRFLVNE